MAYNPFNATQYADQFARSRGLDPDEYDVFAHAENQPKGYNLTQDWRYKNSLGNSIIDPATNQLLFSGNAASAPYLSGGVDFNGQKYYDPSQFMQMPDFTRQRDSWSDKLNSGLNNGLGVALIGGGLLAAGAGAAGAAGAGAAEGAGAAGWTSGFDLAGGGALGGAEAAGAGAGAAGAGAGAAPWTSGYDIATGGALPGGAAASGAGAAASAAGNSFKIPGTDITVPGNVIAGGAQAILGWLGSQQQANAFSDVANQQNAIGAPFRNQLQQSYSPDFNLMNQPGYGDAFNRAADISSRSWSARAGNPADSPTAQAGILSDVWNQSYLPALSNYRGQLGQFGGLGLNTAGAASLANANNAGSGLDALAFGANTAFNPQPDWSKIFQQYGSGNSPLRLSIGGNTWGGS